MCKFYDHIVGNKYSLSYEASICLCGYDLGSASAIDAIYDGHVWDKATGFVYEVFSIETDMFCPQCGTKIDIYAEICEDEDGDGEDLKELVEKMVEIGEEVQ